MPDSWMLAARHMLQNQRTKLNLIYPFPKTNTFRLVAVSVSKRRVQLSCITSTEIVNGLLGTATSTFAQLLSYPDCFQLLLYIHRDRTDYSGWGAQTATSTFTSETVS